jgi:hypothetical protein
MKLSLSFLGVFWGLVISFSFGAVAQTQGQAANIPHCYGYQHQVLALENSKVIQLKQTTKNNYKEQVFVKVYLVQSLADTVNSYGRHAHFIVSLVEPGSDSFKNRENIIEISDSLNDYTSPSVEDLGHGPIYICGEYATTDPNGLPAITKFTPSQTGAMIHWTHLAGPNIEARYSHPNGWIFVNGKTFGSAQAN